MDVPLISEDLPAIGDQKRRKPLIALKIKKTGSDAFSPTLTSYA